MRKIVVDIGRYITSYTIIKDNEVENFRSFISRSRNNTVDINEVLKDDRLNFTTRVFDDLMTIVKDDGEKFDSVDLIIPSKDFLIQSNKPIREELIRNFFEKELEMDLEGIAVGINKPYKGNNKYYVPFSIFSDDMIKELNRIKDIFRYDINIRIFSTLSCLIERASKTEGVSVIFDSSFSGTKALVAVDGVAVEYTDLGISGEALLRTMYKDDSSFESINNSLNMLSNKQESTTEEFLSAKFYLENKKNRVLIPFLENIKPENIIVFGGMGETTLFDLEKFNVSKDMALLSDNTKNYYKFIFSLFTSQNSGEMNSVENIETLKGSLDYTEYKMKELDTEELNERIKQLSKNMARDDRNILSSKLIDLMSSRMSINNQIYRRNSDEENLRKELIYSNSNKNPDYEIVKNEGSLLNYHNISDSDIALKKSLKKYKVSYTPSIISAKATLLLLTLIISFLLIFASQKYGLIKVKLLEDIGIRDTSNRIELETVKMLKNRFNILVDLTEESPKSFLFKTVSLDDKKVKVMIESPSKLSKIDSIDDLFYYGFRSLEYKEGTISVEKVLTDNSKINRYMLEYDISYKYRD